jgi:hypothetical protein
MPFALLIIGGVMLVSAARGTTTQTANGGPGLFPLLQSDFTGSNNFVFWFLSIIAIGAVGYIPKLKPLSVAFLTLVVIALFLSKGNPNAAGGGFFTQLLAGLGDTEGAATVAGGQLASSAGNLSAGASQGGSSLTSLLSGVEPTNPLSAPTSGVPSDASLSGSSLTDLLSNYEPTNTTASPVATAQNYGFSLPGSSSDLSFPALGV